MRLRAVCEKIFRTIAGDRFRIRRFIAGLKAREKRATAGGNICGGRDASVKDRKIAGKSPLQRALRAGPPWSIAAVVSAIGKSGFLLLGGVKSLGAETVRNAADDLYVAMPRRWRKTLTLDNGKEFAEHELLADQTGLKIYFTDPYCAWQRGTIENTNGLIRKYFPKGTDLAAVPNRKFEKVQNLLNNRPRKRLGYKTPYEVLKSQRSVAFEI
jgi:transposase InsO family protein